MKHIDDIPDAQLERMTYAEVSRLEGVTVTNEKSLWWRHNKWVSCSMREAATRPINRKRPVSPDQRQAFDRYLQIKFAQGAL